MHSAICGVPPHVTLNEGTSFQSALHQIQECCLVFPLLAKSLWADGRPGSHDIAVVHTGKCA